MHHSQHKQKKRAELLNEASELIYRTHHTLNWTNFFEPNIKDLGKIKERLEKALENMQRVIDDDLNDPPSYHR